MNQAPYTLITPAVELHRLRQWIEFMEAKCAALIPLNQQHKRVFRYVKLLDQARKAAAQLAVKGTR